MRDYCVIGTDAETVITRVRAILTGYGAPLTVSQAVRPVSCNSCLLHTCVRDIVCGRAFADMVQTAFFVWARDAGPAVVVQSFSV